MFKTLASFVVVAAVVANCQAYLASVQSGSSNSGLNVASSNSHVAQNNIQNAQAVAGGYGYPYGGYGGYAYGAAPVPAPLAAPLPAPVPAAFPGYYPYEHVPYGYGAPWGGANVVSASNNQGANILSSDSTVAQNNVQNAAARGY